MGNSYTLCVSYGAVARSTWRRHCPQAMPPPCRPCNSPGLLCGDRRFATTQYIFLDLAGGGLGQFSHKRERFRHFEVCHVVANKGTQLLHCCALPCLEYDKCMRGLAPLHIGQTHHYYLLDRRVTQEHALNLD